MNFKEYYDLQVWKECEDLVVEIYGLSAKYPYEENNGLKSQIRRASISILSNIAEGCGRGHTKDKLRFFYISRGSLYEVESQSIISRRLEFITSEECKALLFRINICKRVLNGFITYHQNLNNKK